MAFTKVLRSLGAGAALLVLPSAACGDDGNGEQNVLPTAGPSSSDGGDSDTGTSNPTTTADTTAGGGGGSFPATYRFDCIDIIEMGDSDGDGVADGGAFQATLLQNTWASDIDNHKLNIMLTVRERDEAAGTASIVIGSGIGMSNDDQCIEPSSLSPEYPAGFDAGAAMWQPSGGTDTCVETASGEGFAGTYTFQLAASDTIYIYAQDDDGTAFNCVPGGGGPNAVPLHAITATVTVDANDQIAGGQLTGCLVESEAANLCSCLGECAGAANPDCGGCPDGATPLATLLGGVMSTDNCTNLMGETAYDLTVGFTTQRLSIDEPEVCG